eukprot:766808-Hanusia_phi.AAC.3
MLNEPALDEEVVVVFMCKSNSARSVVAECIAKKKWQGPECHELDGCPCPGWEGAKKTFYSAGTQIKKESLTSTGIKVGVTKALERAGYDILGLRSKAITSLTEELGHRRIHYGIRAFARRPCSERFAVVTMCCEAEGDLKCNVAVRRALGLDGANALVPKHLSFPVCAPTDACRREGLTGMRGGSGKSSLRQADTRRGKLRGETTVVPYFCGANEITQVERDRTAQWHAAPQRPASFPVDSGRVCRSRCRARGLRRYGRAAAAAPGGATVRYRTVGSVTVQWRGKATVHGHCRRLPGTVTVAPRG